VNQVLFLRSKKSVVPNSAARKLAEASHDYYAKCSHILGAPLRHTLNIATLEGALESFLIPMLAQKKLNEHLNFSISVASTSEILLSLKQAQVQMGILSRPLMHSQFYCKEIAQDKMVAVYHKPFLLKEIHLLRWIFVFEGSYLNRVSKVPSESFVRTGSLKSAIQLVQAKCGVAIVPKRLIQGKSGLFVLPLPKLEAEKVFLCWSKNLPEICLKFAEELANNSHF
jgi:DNA-binding transcriptional LysR family regulator